MEASLTCAVCLSLFEEPVTLPLCSHNFCRACVLACLAQAQQDVQPSLFSTWLQPSPSQQQPGPQAAELGFESDSEDEDDEDYEDEEELVSVSCPLCRKVCALPAQSGVAALPVNKTLAEVVKLFKACRGARPVEKPGEEGPADVSGPVQDVPCEKHPDKPLQLFCRVCCRPACGQCVSEEHGNIFHSVNLIGAVYQEEKLTFYSCLKELKSAHDQLVKEVAACQNDMKAHMYNEEEMIERAFEKISAALEVKKKELFDRLRNIKKERERYEMWKNVKDTYKKTTETYLKECEKIVNETDPRSFLEVACSLNHRMKTQIDLIKISSRYQYSPGYKQTNMDITPVINSIFALHLSPLNMDAFKDIPSTNGRHLVFGNTEEKCEKQKKIQTAFSPVAGTDVLPDGRKIYTQLMSISESLSYGGMSHEEVRCNYYMARQGHDPEKHTSPQNGRYTMPESSCSSIRAPEAPLFSINGCVKQNQDAETSVTSADRTKNPNDKSNMESEEPKKMTVEKSEASSYYAGFRNLMHSCSFFFMEKMKSETEGNAANKTSVSANLAEQNNQLENPSRNEKAKENSMQSHALRNGVSCMINTVSDEENLSQESNLSDSHTF